MRKDPGCSELASATNREAIIGFFRTYGLLSSVHLRVWSDM